jgi:hypothetical protein
MLLFSNKKLELHPSLLKILACFPDVLLTMTNRTFKEKLIGKVVKKLREMKLRFPL